MNKPKRKPSGIGKRSASFGTPGISLKYTLVIAVLVLPVLYYRQNPLKYIFQHKLLAGTHPRRHDTSNDVPREALRSRYDEEHGDEAPENFSDGEDVKLPDQPSTPDEPDSPLIVSAPEQPGSANEKAVQVAVETDGAAQEPVYSNSVGTKYDASFHIEGSLLRGVSLPSHYLLVRENVSNQVYEDIPAIKLVGPKGKVPVQYIGRLKGAAAFLVTITYSGQHTLDIRRNTSTTNVAPFVYKFRIRGDGCVCPMSYTKFRAQYRCSKAYDELLDAEFSGFQTRTISEADMDSLKPSPHIVKYYIINNELYGSADGRGESWRYRELLLSVLRKVRVPNTAILVSGSDYSYLKGKQNVILFSPCRKLGYRDLLWPTPQMYKNWKNGFNLILPAAGGPWKDRHPMAYFRGTNTGKGQTKLSTWRNSTRWRVALVARERPDLTDVKIWPRVALPPEVMEEVMAANVTTEAKASIYQNLRYKYVLQVDGNTASWRLPQLLGFGSVMFKQDSNWTEFFQPLLKPMTHYLPLQADFSDLIEKIEWAQNHDAELEAMATNAQQFFFEYLRTEDIYCWIASSVRRTAKFLTFSPSSANGMKPFPNPSHNCKCKQADATPSAPAPAQT